jgi:hypothetical protein
LFSWLFYLQDLATSPYYAGEGGKKNGKATTTFINVVVQLAVLYLQDLATSPYYAGEGEKRWVIRLIEGNEECRHLKKF